jgi:hypothetical protein
MHTNDIWQINLQFMIPFLNKNPTPRQKPKVRISKYKVFKFFIFGDPMMIPRKHVLIHKFLLTLSIKR